MKKPIGQMTFFISLFCTSGCCPNGCFVLTGKAYEELAHPKPPRESWFRAETSDEIRKADWKFCGGADDGDFTPRQESLNAERHMNEKSDIPSYRRLYKRFEKCMSEKGYEHREKILR